MTLALVVSNLLYPVIAVGVAALLCVVVVIRHHRPKSVEANMRAFNKGLRALAPEDSGSGRVARRRMTAVPAPLAPSRSTAPGDAGSGDAGSVGGGAVGGGAVGGGAVGAPGIPGAGAGVQVADAVAADDTVRVSDTVRLDVLRLEDPTALKARAGRNASGAHTTDEVEAETG
jgi:hypothetical protein